MTEPTVQPLEYASPMPARPVNKWAVRSAWLGIFGGLLWLLCGSALGNNEVPKSVSIIVWSLAFLIFHVLPIWMGVSARRQIRESGERRGMKRAFVGMIFPILWIITYGMAAVTLR